MGDFKGILLCGGSGTRLYPMTTVVNKQLLPVYDKPMCYYSLSMLMIAEVRDVLVITTPSDHALYKQLLGDGSRYGMWFKYAVQEKPNGIAQAFTIGKEFVGVSNVLLVLGDNIFYGNNMTEYINRAKAAASEGFASIFVHSVKDPERYGVAEIDLNGVCASLEEKPSSPKSSYAVTGLYAYPSGVCHRAEGLKPSARGELEITDLNREYMKDGKLHVEVLPRGIAWLDTGTVDSLQEAASFVGSVENRQGTQIACLEEIALSNGWIDKTEVRANLQFLGKGAYGEYVKSLVAEDESC